MNLKPAILRILDRMDGTPMTEVAVADSIRMAFPGTPMTEIHTQLSRAEADGLIACRRNEILDTLTWSLTEKGRHAATQL